MNTAGYVYVVEGDDGICKIGLTNDPATRMKALQKTSAMSLTFAAIFQTSNPRRLERELHDFFAEQRLFCEWFRLSRSDIDQCARIALAAFAVKVNSDAVSRQPRVTCPPGLPSETEFIGQLRLDAVRAFGPGCDVPPDFISLDRVAQWLRQPAEWLRGCALRHEIACLLSEGKFFLSLESLLDFLWKRSNAHPDFWRNRA